jgi:hypothetical protein
MTEISAYKEKEVEPKGWPRPLLIVFGVTGILVLWTAIFCGLVYVLRDGLPPVSTQNSVSDLATLIFGTAGISLAIFSLLAAGVAIVGWQEIKESARKEIEDSLRAKIEALDMEMRGRQLASSAMVLGLLYSRRAEGGAREDDRARKERESYLAEAVQLCWQAYSMLREVKSRGQYMALNNYVHFSCLIEGPSTQSFILKRARELRAAAEERNYWEALLTYCQAVARFGDREEELRDALKLATELSSKTELKLTERQMGEAAVITASLSERLTSQGQMGEGA